MKNKINLISLVIVSIVFLLFHNSCDKRKLSEQVIPAPPPKCPPFIKTTIIKDADTILKYSTNPYTEITYRINVDSSYLNESTSKMKLKVHFISGSGSIVVNGLNKLTLDADTMFSVDQYTSLKFTPSTGAKTNILMSVTDACGNVHRDTIWFWTKVFLPVAYKAVLTPPSPNKFLQIYSRTFDIKITSADLTGQMTYFMYYTLPSTITNGKATILLGTKTFNSGGNIAIGDNTFTLKLTGHDIGYNYKIPIQIVDVNGDSKYDTIDYNVVTPDLPVINSASVNYTKNCSGTWSTYTNVGSSNSCPLWESKNNCTLIWNVVVNASSLDTSLGTAATIIGYKILVPSVGGSYQGALSQGNFTFTLPYGTFIYNRDAYLSGPQPAGPRSSIIIIASCNNSICSLLGPQYPYNKCISISSGLSLNNVFYPDGAGGLGPAINNIEYYNGYTLNASVGDPIQIQVQDSNGNWSNVFSTPFIDPNTQVSTISNLP